MFAVQLSGIVEALEKRLLPTFASIEDEAKAVANETWERFMSAPGTGDEDAADFAEEAEQAGVSHYPLLYGMRVGVNITD